MPDKFTRVRGVPCVCRICGAHFRRSPSHIRSPENERFCGRACHDVWRSGRPDEVRFWPRVEKTDDCWLWVGPVSPYGYGVVYRQGGSMAQAHRLAWELVEGPIPEGSLICHACDNRRCVRNDDEGVYVVDGVEYRRRGHLWLGTPEANMRDMVAKERDRWSVGSEGHRRSA